MEYDPHRTACDVTDLFPRFDSWWFTDVLGLYTTLLCGPKPDMPYTENSVNVTWGTTRICTRPFPVYILM
ncbi:hypothetical protein J6590_058194 [Homalodisca vitripennis]|nr:hypothetical protein J6590_058194 [Homalodisca vitripennis]